MGHSPSGTGMALQASLILQTEEETQWAGPFGFSSFLPQALLMSKEVDQGGGGGYLVEAAGPLVLAAFSCPASALRWALSVLEALTQLEAWPQVGAQGGVCSPCISGLFGSHVPRTSSAATLLSTLCFSLPVHQTSASLMPSCSPSDLLLSHSGAAGPPAG
jgi:hypothetical protein